MKKYEHKQGEVVDGWFLQEPLGTGGSGEVWVAEKDGVKVALKLLQRRLLDPEDKRFLRFRDEALTHARLAPKHSGLLPLIAFSIPDKPEPDAPAWLATPVAVSVRQALLDEPFVASVEAVLSVANTLVGMHAENVSHRDIKPGNLYQFEGRWAIGDLGLVDYPDKDSLTETGERLGPWNYLAPEMLDEAKWADGTKADVYSLAKTLWVLATEQNIPPGGELRTDSEFGIGAFRPHLRAHQLDLLIERSTRHDPTLRPTMKEFADELRAWLTPIESGRLPNLAALLAKLRLHAGPSLSTHANRKEQEEQAQALVNRLRNQMQPLAIAFTETSLSNGEVMSNTSIRERLFGPPVAVDPIAIWESGLIITASVPAGQALYPPGPGWIHLSCVVSIELRRDSSVRLGGGFIIDTPMFGSYRSHCTERVGILGSAALDHAAAEVLAHLTNHLPEVLEEFTGWVERKGEPPR